MELGFGPSAKVVSQMTMTKHFCTGNFIQTSPCQQCQQSWDLILHSCVIVTQHYTQFISYALRRIYLYYNK